IVWSVWLSYVARMILMLSCRRDEY
ncbi:hypothetical protein D046_7314D, partial [Vibrio parahaemolyticus V-223/04]